MSYNQEQELERGGLALSSGELGDEVKIIQGGDRGYGVDGSAWHLWRTMSHIEA